MARVFREDIVLVYQKNVFTRWNIDRTISALANIPIFAPMNNPGFVGSMIFDKLGSEPVQLIRAWIIVCNAYLPIRISLALNWFYGFFEILTWLSCSFGLMTFLAHKAYANNPINFPFEREIFAQNKN